MTVQELYDYITKNMTPEQALKKLLEGTLIEYQQLKFSEEGKEIHPAMLIAMASMEMNWMIVIPNDDDDDELNGMIVGTEDYIKSVLGEPEHKCNCEGGCNNMN